VATEVNFFVGVVDPVASLSAYYSSTCVWKRMLANFTLNPHRLPSAPRAVQRYTLATAVTLLVATWALAAQVSDEPLRASKAFAVTCTAARTADKLATFARHLCVH
jgi:hypothetical protein